MKKILILSILFFSVGVHAQTDSSEIELNAVNVVFVKLPDSTAFGAPDGKLVSKEIGAAGGTIISDDGRLELIFPAGALSVNTAISIQPIVNLIPNGNGKAYQFEPSGINFQKPVQIIFHYSDAEAEICPPELKFMAIQDKNGKWEYMDYEDWDSTTKLLRGHISHFSDAANGNSVQLSTVDTTLKVGKSFKLDLKVVGDEDLPPLPIAGEQVSWSLVSGRRTGTLTGGTQYYATYTAPNFLPGKDAKVVLTISRTTIERVVQRTRHKKGGFLGETRVPHTKNSRYTCDIKLYDDYRISIIHEGPSGLRCGAEVRDGSIFKARLFSKKVEITDEINSEPMLSKQPNCNTESRGGRSAQYTIIYDAGGCQGPVHVSKDKLSGYGMLISNQNSAPSDITIEFAPTNVKIMKGKIHYPPTPGGSFSHFNRKTTIPTTQAADESADAEDINVGNKIQFIANRERQEYDRPGDKIEHSFKLIIEPL